MNYVLRVSEYIFVIAYIPVYCVGICCSFAADQLDCTPPGHPYQGTCGAPCAIDMLASAAALLVASFAGAKIDQLHHTPSGGQEKTQTRTEPGKTPGDWFLSVGWFFFGGLFVPMWGSPCQHCTWYRGDMIGSYPEFSSLVKVNNLLSHREQFVSGPIIYKSLAVVVVVVVNVWF